MKGFFKWFSSGAKMKRWMLLTLAGVACVCYGLAEIFVMKELSFLQVGKIVLSFVIGFIGIVLGLIYMQKRTLEILVEASDKRMEEKSNVNLKSLIFNKKIYSEGPNIVVIGGGSGLNTVLSGLKNYTSNLTAIVTVSDYGKLPSNSRRELKALPLDDLKESIIALSDHEEEMRQLLDYEFLEGKLNQIRFSDLYFYAMNHHYANLSEAIGKTDTVLNMTGKVLPVTLDEIKICAELDNGMVVEEKDKIPEVTYNKITKINRIYISPSNCKAAPGVVEAIKQADCIIIGPGSLYTNVIPNLLVGGVTKAIKESKAIKVYISNIMTEPGQTDDYGVAEHVKAILDHAGQDILDFCIYDTGEVIPEYIKKYNEKGKDLVEQNIDKIRGKGIQFLQRNLSCIKEEAIRHNPDAIAGAVIEIICDDLKFKDKQTDPQYLMLKAKLAYEKKLKHIPKAKTKKEPKAKREKGKQSKFIEMYGERVNSIKNADKQKRERQKQLEKRKNLAEREELLHQMQEGLREIEANKMEQKPVKKKSVRMGRKKKK